MSYLLEILGRGLLAELSAAFRDLLHDDGHCSTEELRTAFEGMTDSPEAAVRHGIRCLANRNHIAARSAFESALASQPDNLPAPIGLACICDELGRVHEAIAHLATARQYHSQDPAVLFALGFCREKQGNTDQAVADYQDCIRANPKLRNAHERLAAIYLRQHDLAAAIEHYEHICWYEPGEIVPALTLANLYLQHGRAADAIRRYQLVLTIEPDNWEARDDLVSAYEKAGLHDKAVELLTQMIADQPDLPDNHLRLGDLHAKLGDRQQALEYYLTAANTNPDHLEASIKVGTSHLRRGDYLEAARWFSRAVEINDRLLTAYVGLGVAQHELGQTDEAMATFEMAASIEPSSTLLFSETARLHLKLAVNRQVNKHLWPGHMVRDRGRRSAEAVGDLIDRQIERHRSAVRERPNYADLHYRLGLLLKHRGQNVEAIHCFRQAAEINPNYTAALIQLGLSLHDAGRTDEGIQTLTRALQTDPESIELHYHLGLMFTDRRRFTMAMEQFEQGLEKDPGNIDFHANLALALQEMGLIDRAAGAWHTLCELAHETEAGGDTLRRIQRENIP